jgi:hypothetical protein
MRKPLISILFFFIIACSTKSEVLKDTDYLRHGQRASIFQKVWGSLMKRLPFSIIKLSITSIPHK